MRLKADSYIYKNRRIRNTVSTVITVLACVLFCFLYVGTNVSASNNYSPLEIDINFECIKNLKLTNGKYLITINSNSVNTPAPDKDIVEITDGKGSFHITVNEPGDYTYLVYQKKGTDIDTVYDDTKYEIHISVMNSESGEELTYYMSVNYAGTDNKPEEIVFKNTSVHDDETVITTETTETDETKKDNKKIITGDTFDIYLVLGIMIISVIVITEIFKIKRNKSNQ